MTLSIGDKLGPYEILALVGKGGMGEVYRAYDDRLHRDVAIKVSNAQFTERFTREARAIAALNHTNICHLYDVGPDYLVMEYVEGQDLRGPLDFDSALPLLRQLIDGIEAAHEKNIVHRDLKPANIKVTPEGVVKILDFGLAKAMESPPSNDGHPENSPTLTIAATQAGAILGTAAYMAPEQAKGKAADKRSDIWSFGVIVHEVLTGKRLFPGDTAVEILGAILHREPDLSEAPPRVHKLLRWCLEKDRKQRLASISDARMLLEEAPSGPVPAPLVEASPQTLAGIRALSAIATLAILAAIVLAFLYFRTSPRNGEFVAKLSVLPPPNVSFASESAPAISPDGRKLAFIGRDASGKTMLWVRPLDSLEARLFAGTENARDPFWSPDSNSIGFFYQTELKRVDLADGAVRTLCKTDNGNNGGTWNSEGVILIGSNLGPVFRVPSGGGTCQPATGLSRERQERAHAFPQFLPDGRHFLYLARSGKQGSTDVLAASLDSKETKPMLLSSSSQVAYAAPGYLMFARGQTLMAQRFDADRLEVVGDPSPVAEQLAINLFGDGMFSVSANGELAFRSGAVNTQLTWFDRSGKALGSVGLAGDYVNLALSADGKHVAFQRRSSSGDRDIWQMEIDRPVPTRVTFSPSDETNPLWSPDGSTIVFASNRDGPVQLFRKSSNGVGAEELLVKTEGDSMPTEFSADGRFLFFRMVNKQGINECWVLPMTGERKPFGYLQSNDFHQNLPRLSPSGRWLADFTYGSVGTAVYLQSFPKQGGKWEVGKGALEKWSRDGKELFYFTPNGDLMAAAIKGENTPEIGTPVPLFAPRILGAGRLVLNYRNQYDVAPDGRFLIIVPVDEGAGSSITVFLNWTGLLRK